MALRALVGAAVAIGAGVRVSAQAAPAAGTGRCHADVLVKNLDYAAMTAQEQASVSQAVAQKIALETGVPGQDVLAKVFPGNYNAAWSPSANRPPADAFLASLINGCTSAEMVLGVMRGPQLQSQLIAALNSALGNSPAVKGELSVIGTSVVPEDRVPATPAPGPGVTPAPLPPGPLASGGDQQGASNWVVWVVVVVVLLAVAAALPVVLKKVRESRGDDDEEAPFTGH